MEQGSASWAPRHWGCIPRAKATNRRDYPPAPGSLPSGTRADFPSPQGLILTVGPVLAGAAREQPELCVHMHVQGEAEGRAGENPLSMGRSLELSPLPSPWLPVRVCFLLLSKAG